MKILMICTVPLERNGIATCVTNYACALTADGQDIHILAAEGVSPEGMDTLTANGVHLHRIPSRKSGTLGYCRHLWKHLRAQRYDIVHIHGNSCTMAIELLIALLAGCPVRIAHGHSSSCEHKRAHKLLRPVFELCINGRFACSQKAGRWLYRNKPFTVVRNGISLDQYQPDPALRTRQRQALGISENALVLGHVGAFAPVKNHEFLVQLAQKLQYSLTQDWIFLLVGDGELHAQIRQSFEEAGLSDHVIFTGSVPSSAPYLQAMDLFLLPSLYEGLPFVLVEAQAAGLPCLVSDRVSSEANISKTLRFLSIERPDQWEQTIAGFTPWDREQASRNACRQLTEAGYNIHSNISALNESYLRLRNK